MQEELRIGRTIASTMNDVMLYTTELGTWLHDFISIYPLKYSLVVMSGGFVHNLGYALL